MTKTKTLQTLVCVLVLLGGAVAMAPTHGSAEPAQTLVATSGTAATGSTPSATKSDPSTTTTTSATGLSVSRLVIATDVKEREPVGAASTFSVATSTKLYAFVEIKNPTAQASTLELAWLELATGKEQHSYTLQIQAGKRWRTWARATAPKKPGSWAVLVRDENGVELSRTPFDMTE